MTHNTEERWAVHAVVPPDLAGVVSDAITAAAAAAAADEWIDAWILKAENAVPARRHGIFC